MGESRQELVQWLNSLLQLNITKVEQCGTGAALCQVFDSIFLDVPMSKVKFNVNTEYAYIQNYKVLQNTFTKHQIDKPIPVASLVKCKMQDNLEFLQWTKRFWDQYYPGGEYDAVERRKGSGKPAPAGGAAATRMPAGGAARRPGGTPPTTGPRLAKTAGGGTASAALQQENKELKEYANHMQFERNFYYWKLYGVEMLIEEAKLNDENLTSKENSLANPILEILLSKEGRSDDPPTGDDQGAFEDQEGFEEGNFEEQETF